MVTVVCARWLDAFPSSYIRILRNAVQDQLGRRHRFICVTDNPNAIDDDIETALLPDTGIPLKHQRTGGWPKLGIFAAGVLPDDAPALYLDLDVVIRGSLDCFFSQIENRGGFHSIREWNPTLWNLLPARLRPDRGVQGSMLGFIPREHYWVHEFFRRNQERILSSYYNEQQFLGSAIVDRHYWPLPWTASFKRHCTHYYPINLLLSKNKEPRRAKVVIFHGTPRPIDLVPLGNYRWGGRRRFGYGPVPWVRGYWLRYDASWQEQEPTSPTASP